MTENLIKYYNACFQADNNSLTVSNFFGNSVEHRLIFEEEQLINGILPYYPVDEDYAVNADKTVKLYEKEKEFVYCSLFIIGKTVSFSNRMTKICSPLIIHPAKIIQSEDMYFVEIEKSERRVNFSLLNKIRENEKDNEIFFEQIAQTITGFEIDDTTLFGLTDIFKTFIPELDVDDLTSFPALYNEKKLKRYLSSQFLNDLEGYKILPASGAGIIKRSLNTRGIINELNEIAKIGQFSEPLKVIFEGKEYTKKTNASKGKVPAVLNNAQKDVLEYAPRYPASLIVGPPGTGKTYTIAALAVEQMSKGKSVLIASGTDQAVDVIGQKIEEQLGLKNVVIRGGSKQYLRDLKNYLHFIFTGFRLEDGHKHSDILFKETELIEKEINSLEAKFKKQTEKELTRGKFLHDYKNRKNLFKKIKKRILEHKIENTEPLSDIINEIYGKLGLLNIKTKEFISNKHAETTEKILYSNYDELRLLDKAIRARTSSKQSDYFKDADFRVILKVFPIWLVKMNDIDKILPLYREMFDIAVIDEATQCNIASSIPIIQRAKQVVLTGDPNQLRHVSFLSQARRQNLLDIYELNTYPDEITDYRHNSILDLVDNCLHNRDQSYFLDEHYRSMPSIIRFSNEKFYSNALRVMKSKPDLNRNEGSEIIMCNGIRTTQGINVKEAEAVIEKVKEIILEENGITDDKCHSIGILSPFRNQTDYISEKIKEQFNIDQISKHKIRVSTAYGFQGDERDIMLLTFVLDNNSHPTAFRHINDPHVFNVSITRAKLKQYIYHSLDIAKIPIGALLREFLESFQTKESEHEFAGKDEFIDEVVTELHKKDIKTWKAFPVAGLNVDIIAKSNDVLYGIDLIGFPGEFEDAFSLERYKMLQRAGLKTIPVSYARWIIDKDTISRKLIWNLT